MPAVVKRNPLLVKFLLKVDKNGPIHPVAGQCWIWTAGKTGEYGQCSRSFGDRRAHRVMWTFYYGPIPAGLFVCHSCDNMLCVNPKHLFVGTQRDNMQDMAKKGRQVFQVSPEKAARGTKNGSRTQPHHLARGSKNGSCTKPECLARGEQHGRAKLTESVVAKARQLHKGGISYTKLAKMFGVVWPVMKRAVDQITWKHVK